MKIHPLIAAGFAALPLFGANAHSQNDFNHEPIIKHPIGDLKNNFWYDYLSDISEAEHELIKDLRRATDAEDRADAREEYRNEIADANKDYRKEMHERGYRTGSVSIVGN